MPLRRSRKRQQLNGASALREQQIVEAAVDRFFEQGYAGTSVEDLAGDLGMLKASLFHYIDSKEDLLFRIMEEVHEGYTRVYTDVSRRDDLTPLELLHEYLRELFRLCISNDRRFAVYWRERDRLGPDRQEQMRRWSLENERLLMSLIEDAVDAGELPGEINARRAMYCSRGVLASLNSWYQPTGTFSPRELADFGARFVIEGLGAGVAPETVAHAGVPGDPPAPSPPPRSKRKRKPSSGELGVDSDVA